MTIKQQGGIFGRNPTFNDVEIDGTATLNSVDATSVTTEGLTVNAVQNTLLEANQSGTVRNLLISNANVGVANRAGMYFQPSNSIATSYIDGVAEDDASTSAKRDGSIVFGTRLNGSFTDQVKITSQGNIAILNSGQGIDFSATSGTGTSELFDDYEEGTFTPAWDNLTVGNAPSNLGRYTKVGRIVTIEVYLKWGSTTSASGSFVINNLPFFSASDQRPYGVGNILDFGARNYSASCYVNTSATSLVPVAQSTAHSYSSNSTLSATVPMTWTTDDQLRLSVTYTAA